MKSRLGIYVCAALLIGACYGCGGGVAAGPSQPQPSAVSTVSSKSSPQVSVVSPAAVAAGTVAFLLSVSGSNFGADPVLLWNGNVRATTLVGADSVTTPISAEDVAVAEQVLISIRDQSTGQTSSAMPLTISDHAVPLQIVTAQLPDAQANAAYDVHVSAEGGVPPYRWSFVSGVLPDGVTVNATGAISGTATSSGHFFFTIGAADSSLHPAIAESSLGIDVAAAGTSNGTTATPLSTSFYGPGIGADALCNTTIGPFGHVVSYRFRAKNSGSLEKIRVYLIPDRAGYAAGTGGELEVSLQTDDGTTAHRPSGTKLSSALVAKPLAETGAARYFPVLSSAVPPTITAGDLYHIVFKNVDLSPTFNFVSVDSICYLTPSTPNQPTFNDLDVAVLLGSDSSSGGSAWDLRKGYTPIYELYYTDGATEGSGYLEAWSGAPRPISGTDAVREIFTVTGSQKNVSNVGVRVARMSGTGSLKLHLQQGDGTTLEDCNVPASSFPVAASYAWVNCSFSATHTLSSGQTYALVLEAPSGSYQAFPIRKGSKYGFGDKTYYTDGYAEFKNSASGWVGWTQWGVANRTDGDLQLYFGLAP
jgi:hypothetical protein